MDPNAQNSPSSEMPNPTSPVDAQLTPNQPTSPQPAPVFTPPQAAGPPSYTSASVAKPKKAGLIIGVIIGVVVFIVGATAALLLLGSGAKAQKVSTAFMDAVTSGDTEKLFKVAEPEDESAKDFLRSAAESSKGTYKLKEKTTKNGKSYFLYTLSNEKGKEARTIVEDQKGKLVVGSYVFGSDNLALIPKDSGDDTKSSTPTASTTTTPATASACLVQSDFDAWYKKDYGKTATEYNFHFEKADNEYTTNVHFPADSLEYKGYDNVGGVENITALATDVNVKNKQFTIRLTGSVGTSQADKDFANKRAEKIKAELVANGIPASKITIGAPGSATDFVDNPTEVDKSRDRVVVIIFDPTCTSTATPTTSGTGR